ncbi:phosphotransferase [Synechococcus sp. 1G10]|uniref:phosphotransferase n=1 Tax=Synechococcus sp. 1G10 TaxID=2025605 RepID=UPI00117F91CA|nr:phosphotransferase [Synechococcus sp. 1G10]
MLRRYFQADSLSLQHWEVQALFYAQIVGGTEGLFHIKGEVLIAGESRSWTMVVKLIAAESDPAIASTWFYAQREALAYKSLILDTMTGVLSAPKCYGITLCQNSKIWLWLENVIADEPPLWTINCYANAAFGLGEAAALLQPQLFKIRDTPLTYSFASSWCKYWFRWYGLSSVDSVRRITSAQSYVSARQLQNVLQLLEEAGSLIEQYHLMPQTFCHHDTHRLNLIIQKKTKPFARIVAVDWALAGPGPVGADAADLVSGSLLNFCFDMQQAEFLELQVMTRYLDGLYSTQWQGDPKKVEAGYLLQTVLRFEALVPVWLAHWLSKKETEATQRRFNLTEQQIAETWVALLDFVIERRERLVRLLPLL